MLSLSPRLSRTHNITVIRPPQGYFEDMEWVEPTEPVVIPDVWVNIQPFGQKQRRWIAPEGFRVEDLVIVYSFEFHLKTSSVYEDTNADMFLHNGFIYEVIQEQDWTGYGTRTDHRVAMAVKKEPARSPYGGP